MAAHELTFHLWETGFNRNPLHREKYDFSSALLPFCTPWAIGGVCWWESHAKVLADAADCTRLISVRPLCETSDIKACLTWSSLKALRRSWCCTLPAHALGKGKVRVSVRARKSVCEQGAFSLVLPMYTLAVLWVNSPLGSLRPLWVSHSGGWQHCFRSRGRGMQGQGALPPPVAPYCRGLGTLVTSFHAIPVSCRRAAAERELLTIRAECALQILRKEMPT